MHSAGPARERGTTWRTGRTGPAFGALDHGCLSKGPAQPLASLLASSGGSDETPSTFYLHKVFFLGEEASTLWKHRNAPHCGPQPAINLFLTPAFWFINM